MEPLYEARWDSLDQRPTPAWFTQSRFGIFIHWGVYSVPSWAPKRKEVANTGEAFAEWYGYFMKTPGHPIADFHRRVYGEDFEYRQFAPDFRAELYDPEEWASLFARAGARYVTITSKHHDGYCLYPSLFSPGWNSAEVGPGRDLLDGLSKAVRQKGMRFGVYYSLLEWWNKLYLENPGRYAVEHMIPQMQEVIERYQPELLYTDGEWDHPSATLHSEAFLAWLFNESPVRGTIVVNDRWGSETRSEHGGYFTTEYGEVGFGKALRAGRPWEEIRSIGASFGHNRNEDLEDYLSDGALVDLLANTILAGGNLSLNVGPCADGKIHPLVQERLLELGRWVKVNQEGLFETNPWLPPDSEDHTRYTRGEQALYAFFRGWPRSEAAVHIPRDWKGPVSAQMLGDGVPLPCHRDGDRVRIDTRGIPQRGLPCNHVFCFRLQHG